MMILKLILISTVLFNGMIFAQRTSVAVIELLNVGIPSHFSTLLSDALRAEMFKYDKYKVLNRENMKDIMGEQAFQASGLCQDDQCYADMGEVLGVEKIVTGSIGKLGSTYSLTIKMIDVETGESEKIIPYRKKCSEDDLFIMIENAVKILTGFKAEKMSEPDVLTEINEFPSHNSVQTSGEIHEWEILGITREEYKAELARKRYKEELQSPIDNGVKSLVFPGWGNINRAWLYKTVELVGFGTVIVGLFSLTDGTDDGVQYVAFGFSAMMLNHIASPIDAFITTVHHNSELKKKYRISMEPYFDRRISGAGLTLSVVF